MSATATPAALAKDTDDEVEAPGNSAALAIFSTIVALLAAAGALVDLFLCGFWDTALHFTVVLVVFSAIRLCVGVALNPRPHLELADADTPEATP